MSEKHNSIAFFSMNNVAKGHSHSRGLRDYQTTHFDSNKEISRKVGLFFSRMFMAFNLD